MHKSWFRYLMAVMFTLTLLPVRALARDHDRDGGRHHARYDNRYYNNRYRNGYYNGSGYWGNNGSYSGPYTNGYYGGPYDNSGYWGNGNLGNGYYGACADPDGDGDCDRIRHHHHNNNGYYQNGWYGYPNGYYGNGNYGNGYYPNWSNWLSNGPNVLGPTGYYLVPNLLGNGQAYNRAIWGNHGVPNGWQQGRKKGWGKSALPPGLVKKSGRW